MQLEDFFDQGVERHRLDSLKISLFNQGGLSCSSLYTHDIYSCRQVQKVTRVWKNV